MPSAHDSGGGQDRPSTATHKALLDAIERVCRTDGTPTITAVAREVGVSAALIHNRYPDVAATIRTLSGREKRDDVAQLRAALVKEQEIARSLRDENGALLADLRALASVNETLRQELALREAAEAPNVVPLGSRSRAPRAVGPSEQDPPHRA
ncbi:TetR family transcriptional regulator [Variovorax sp. LARHSF232]